ncbi:MAG: autotransporter-associated beta strand repeat-containing protein [Moraxellaceae bacterium]|nr:autotransporter-associated beta strand repeat-containing protein [Moraxellaceae bacterium]
MLANGTSLETAAAVMAKQAVQVTGDVTINTLGHDSSLMGVVSGVGNVHKTNAGRLALEGMNTFTGMVDVQAGSVAINNANSLGADANSVMLANGTSLETAAAVMAKQAVQVTGDVTINTAGHDSSLMGVVSGNANVNKIGSGTLNLQGVNTFAGDIRVSSGTLGVANDANLGAATNKVILNNATLMANLASVVLDHNIDIMGAATFDTAENALRLNAQLAGGSLVKTGTGILELVNANNTQAKTTVNQGKIRVAQNANLGLLDAIVELNGGIFESMATQSYERNFSLGTNNGTFNVLTDDTVTLTKSIDGLGNLNKTGTGTLVLTGTNTYAGGTAINAGTVVVTQAANLGTGSLSISNASLQANDNLTLQNVALTGTANFKTDSLLTVAGIISGSGTLVKQGSGNLALDGVNTYSGGTTLKSGKLTLANGSSLGVGALTVESGQVALKDGFISTNNFVQSLAGSSSTLMGNGTFANINVNVGQLTIDGNMVATNATQVNGLLFVNGKLTSNITVGSSGKLGGSGNLVGTLNVNGILSPGNSPAILTVTGDVHQNTGSTLEIDIDGATAGTGAGHYDQVNASGTYNIAASNTTLDAKLRGITGSANNNFVPTLGQSFDVVKANSVVGTFTNYTQPTTGLATGTRLDIGYTPNSVRLYVTPQSYLTVADTNNATGAAKFLDDVLQVRDTNLAALIGTTDLANLYNALLPASSQQLNAAMLTMSPAIYAESVQSALALQQTLHNTQTLSDSFKKGGIALKGIHQEADIDSDGNGVAATRTVSGIQLSLDSEPYTNNWQMGATLSVVNKADIESQNANITAKGQDVSVSIRKKVNNWMLGAAFDMGSYDFDTKRNVVVGNTVFATHQEGITATTQGLALNASYNMGSLLINSGVRYNAVQQDGFTEAGNSLLKLTVADIDENQVVAMLGGTWSQTWKKSMWDIAPKFGLQLEQTLMGDTAQLNAKLGSQVVNASAADAGKTLLRATAGINFINVDGLSVGFDASVEEGDGLSSKTGRVLFSKSF